MRSKVAAIVLAAGQASRFGAGPDDSKVLALLKGKPLVRHVVETAVASRAAMTMVVVGQAAAKVEVALAGLRVAFTSNLDYATGMASSLKAGIAALPPDIEGALILLADMPCVKLATLDALIAAFAAAPWSDAVVPVHAGRQGNPALIGRTLFDAVAKQNGDEGARKLLAEPRWTVVACAVEDAGIAVDIDTRDALGALRGR